MSPPRWYLHLDEGVSWVGGGGGGGLFALQEAMLVEA
jgi:hypothetical protein